MDQVFPNLWIGDISDAHEESMKQYGIERVITVCQDSVQDNIGCEYEHYNMSDGPQNSYGGDHSFDLYREAADDLYKSLSDDRKTLIHCHKGQSRSVSVAVGAVGRLNNKSVEQSLKEIKEGRPEAQPDDLLIEHARNYIQLNRDQQH